MTVSVSVSVSMSVSVSVSVSLSVSVSCCIHHNICALPGALLREYFVIVKKIIKDMVPKATMRFFVMQSQVEIDGAIISTLYHKVWMLVKKKQWRDVVSWKWTLGLTIVPSLSLQEENIEGLLKEDEDVVQKRKQAKEHERVLLAAIRTIEESRNFRF